jgi:hypothetical protein
VVRPTAGFPGTPAATIEMALSLTSGHGGKAEAELERITGSKAVDALNMSASGTDAAQEAGEIGAPVSDRQHGRVSHLTDGEAGNAGQAAQGVLVGLLGGVPDR